MKQTIFTILLAFISIEMLAQQIVLADSITQNSVSYATVYDADGTVIGRSDIRGYINLQKGVEYHISHIGYMPKRIIYNEDSIILLSPSSYKLSEVTATAKRKKYYRFKIWLKW